MMQKLNINITLPSLNEIIKSAGYDARSRKSFATLKRNYTRVVSIFIDQCRLKPIRKGFFKFEWVEKNRKRDKDNVAAGGRKIIFDALVKNGILLGDGWDFVDGWVDTFTTNKSGSGVVVTIYERGNHESKETKKEKSVRTKTDEAAKGSYEENQACC